mgnify:CR=1 FL=1|jgi:hypothetical protein|tara:strand:- start:628 stop:927 length:300 start_codon:yes stop_codon:yes gene_type:complete
MKIAVNKSPGGFCVSAEVMGKIGLDTSQMGYLTNKDFNIVSSNEYAYRADKNLINAIQSSKNPNDDFSDIRIFDLDTDINFKILNFDGLEKVIKGEVLC